MDDDATLLERPRDKAGLDSLLGRYARTEEGFDTLPRPGDDYLAHARPGNKTEPMLCFIRSDQSLEILSYGHLARVRLLPCPAQGGGQSLLLRFVEAVVTEVRLEGRGLRTLPDYLRQHRIAWIRELPGGREFGQADSVVSRIDIVEGER
jgi:hypothetical protein